MGTREDIYGQNPYGTVPDYGPDVQTVDPTIDPVGSYAFHAMRGQYMSPLMMSQPAEEDAPRNVSCKWGEDNGVWGNVWFSLGASAAGPSMRVEPTWKDDRWSYVAPVDHRGLEQRGVEWREPLDIMESSLQLAQEQGKLPTLPIPNQWRETEACPIA